MVKEVTGGYKVTYHPVEDDPSKIFEVDFTPPFHRVRMIAELEQKLNVTFPHPSEFNKDSFRAFLDDLCVKNGVECSHPRTAARLLDKVCDW